MKYFKLTLSNIIGLIIICISFIPLYNRYLTHERENHFDFSIKTLLVEYIVVILLLVIFLFTKSIYSRSIYSRRVKFLTNAVFVYVFITFLSVIMSQDVSRSLGLFAFGMIGPLLLYLVLVFKVLPSYSNLKWLIKTFLISNVLFLVIGYLFAFRFGFSSELLEIRSGKNIYGSNSVIGTICFTLPFIFVNRSRIRSLIQSKLLLNFFSMLAIVWIIISLSRWGYATVILTYICVSVLVNKSFSLRKIIGVFVVFVSIMYYIPEISNLIIYRFTDDSSIGSFTIERIYEKTLGEGRLVRWENSISVIKDNPFLGLGLGNNYLVDPFGNSDAHNLFINMLIEQGIFVFIATIFVFAAIYKLVKKVLRTSSDSSLKVLVALLGIGILVFHFWSLTGSTYIQSGGIISAVKNYYFFIAMGMLVYVSKLNDAKASC